MGTIENVAKRSAAGIALAYRSGEAGPVEVVECLFDRIAGAGLGTVFISLTRERALAEAARAAARYREGRPLSPLDGVPVGWKDLYDVAGAPTTAGSKLFSGQPAKTADIACVANAAAAGMVSIGKLNMTELAYSGIGLNPHFATPLNPNAPSDPALARAPGGSSSACGVSVAAGLVPCAIGSDTGGSVRIPAAFNGVVGYKTSTGRIDPTGMVQLAKSFDTIGPLAHTVEDCVLLDMVLRGAPATPVRRADLRGLHLVAPTNVVLESAQPAVAENYERALELFARKGASVRREHVGVLDEVLEMTARHGTLTAAEAYCEYHDLVDSEKVNEIDRRVVHRIRAGKAMSAFDLLSIQRGRARMMQRIAAQLGEALLVMPTTPIVAPQIAPLEADDAVFHEVNILTLRNTMLGNVLDLCGVAIPNGRDGGAMPTSILFSAPHGQDERLLGFALEIERAIREAQE